MSGHTFCGSLEDEISNEFFVALQMKVSEELRPEMRSLDQMMVGLHRLSLLIARYVPWSKHLAMLHDYLLSEIGTLHIEFVPLTTQECYAILSIIFLPKAFSRHSDQSTSYFRYIQEGILESELYTANGSIDPIFTIWPPKPAAVTTTLARSSY